MFKIGDRIICLNTDINKLHYGLNIKVGSIYEVCDILKDGVITIINDDGEKDFYNKRRFISLVEYRKQKIQKICSKLEIG